MWEQNVAKNQIKGEERQTKSFWIHVWGSTRKGVVGSSVVLGVAAMILTVSLVTAADPVRVRARDGIVNLQPTVAATPKGERMEALESLENKQKVEYYLPYPGLLPDSPVYPLKMVRDRVRLWTILDEEGKAKQRLFYADKRINAAWQLFEGGKEELAVTTASKAEKYLEESVAGTIQLTKEGKDVKSALLKQEKATLKHIEVLDNMRVVAHGQAKDMLEDMKVKTSRLHDQVSSVLRENN